MVRIAAFALLLVSCPAVAEPVSFGTPIDEPRTQSQFSLADTDADPPRGKKRGVIAGVDLAPDAAVGFGVFNAAPKRSLSTGDGQMYGSPRQSRKAGVGFSLKF